MVVRDATVSADVVFDYKTGGGLLQLDGAGAAVQANLLRGYAAAAIPSAGTGLLEFVVPAAGYATAPVQVSGSAVGGGASMDDVAPFSVRVSPLSPAFEARRLGALPLISAPEGVTPSRVAAVPANRCHFLLGENAAAPWNWESAGAWNAQEQPHAVGVEIDPPGGFILLIR